jgi:hypothetical protein
MARLFPVDLWKRQLEATRAFMLGHITIEELRQLDALIMADLISSSR